MKQQKGFVDLDGLIPALLIMGAVIGIVICLVVPWLWSLVKPFIHAITG